MERAGQLGDGAVKQAALTGLGNAEKQIRTELNLIRAKQLLDRVQLP